MIRLLWRSRKLPAYRQRLLERFGFYPFKLKHCLWIHAVSVGESLAAIPLIKALIKDYPDLPVLVTTMTPTGAERINAALGDRIKHVYIPYDIPDAVSRFLNTMHPVIAIIMETELWPNLLAICHQKRIPICLMNARLSEKSAAGYQRISSLTHRMMNEITLIASHGENDAKRFIALSAPKENVVVTGNIKFDLELPHDLASKSLALRETLGKNRLIWIAASTHEGEEEIILLAHKKCYEKNKKALLLLVPRHPDRFDKVHHLCEQQGWVIKRRSKQETCDQNTSIYFGDTMGELLFMYSVSDIAFVGGSLIPRGGHNMLEPGALGKPILTGPHLFNFAEISELFFKAHALVKVTDADSLFKQLDFWMMNEAERHATGERAKAVVDANRGALAKQLTLINKVMQSLHR